MGPTMLLLFLFIVRSFGSWCSGVAQSCLDQGLDVNNSAVGVLPPSAVDCCIAPTSGWIPGFYREFYTVATFSAEVPPCGDNDEFKVFKVRSSHLVPLGDTNGYSGYSTRMLGYMVWDPSSIFPSSTIDSEAIYADRCSVKAIVKVGTRVSLFGRLVAVPFIFQVPINPLFPFCRIGLQTISGSQIPLQDGNFTVDEKVRLWMRDKPLWIDQSSVELRNAFNTVCPPPTTLSMCACNAPTPCDTDPFAICDTRWAQCLSLPNGGQSFNITDPDVLWVLSSPGTMDHLVTTANAVDMVMGNITSIALLLQGEIVDQNQDSMFNLSTAPVVLIAVASVNPLIQIHSDPNQLAAFIGTNSFAQLDNSSYPNLKFYSGTLQLGSPLAQMDNVEILQISNAAFSYQNPWVWLDQPARRGFGCAQEVQYYYRGATLGACTAMVGNCSRSDFCLSQTNWPRLRHLAIMGMPSELHSCFTMTPQLQGIFIDGSNMTQFNFYGGNVSLQALRLANNPNLNRINDLRATLTTLQLYGNPKLSAPALTSQNILTELDFSFSTMYKPTSYNFPFKNLKTFRCVACSLNDLPNLQKFMPNVSNLYLNNNQISRQLDTWVNQSEWKNLTKRACVINLSDNAINGSFPVRYESLIALGCEGGETPHLNLDFNLIESFQSPTNTTQKQGVRPWLDAFKMFPEPFSVAVARGYNMPNTRSDRVWLSLRNNRLKGWVAPEILNNSYIDIRDNNFWCDGEIYCQYAIVSIRVFYGSLVQANYASDHWTPFWPYSISKSERQTFLITFLPTGGAMTPYWNIGMRLWENATGELRTVAVLYQGDGFGMSRCTSNYIYGTGFNLSTYNQYVFACRAAITATTSDTVITSNMWLVDTCSFGRGKSSTGTCQSCQPNTWSEWCGNCITPQMNLAQASQHVSCSSCPRGPLYGVPPQMSQSITVVSGAITASQCVCDVGSYGFPGVIINSVATSNCRTCGDAAICDKQNTTNPKAQAGYFKSLTTGQFSLCDPSKACEDGTCTLGYDINFQCLACSDRFYRVNRECRPCFSAAEFLLALLAVFLLLALLFLVRVSKTDYTKIFTLSISLGYVQIISIFAAFPVTWPQTTQDMLNFLSFFNFNFDLASPECAVKTNFWNKWLMKLLLPLIACGVMYLWYLAVRYSPRVQAKWVRFVTRTPGIDRCLLKIIVGRDTKKLIQARALINRENFQGDVREQEMEWERTHLKNRFITATVTLATLGYTFVAKTSTQPFNCLTTEIDTHLRADPGIACYDETWWAWFPVALFFIGLYTVGIPLVFLTVLVRAHCKKKLRDPEFLSLFGGLVLPFREQFWFWELIQLSRKLTTVLLIDFKADTTDTSTFGQINGVLIVLVLFFVLQEFVRPYEFTWCNRLEFAWTGMSLLILVAALVFSFKGALTKDQLNIYAVFLILALVAAFFMTLYTLFLEKRRVLTKVGLGASTHTKIEDDHQMLDTVFGADLGDSVYRKTRAMSPEMRDQFFSKVSNLTPLNKSVQMTNSPLLTDSNASNAGI